MSQVQKHFDSVPALKRTSASLILILNYLLVHPAIKKRFYGQPTHSRVFVSTVVNNKPALVFPMLK